MSSLTPARQETLGATSGPPWLAPVLHRTQLDIQWLVVTLAMLTAGLVFFGWRGLACVCTTSLSALATYVLVVLLMRIIRPGAVAGAKIVQGAGRHEDSSLHALVLGLLLGLSLPPMHDMTVPLLAGLVLGILMPFVGRSHRLRLHPVALVILLVWLMPAVLGGRAGVLLHGPVSGEIEAVLRPDRVLFGDLERQTQVTSQASWWSLQGSESAEETEATDAVARLDPSLLVARDHKVMLQRQGSLVLMLQSGELCRLQELLFGAVPGPMGGSSRALLIVLGIYLMYRRLASWQAALVALVAAVVVLLIMPIDVGDRLTCVGAVLWTLPPKIAATYVGYFILASPLALIVMILAPLTAPMTARGQLIYGMTIGATVSAAIWSFASPQAAFLALVVASVLSRPLDVMKRSPFVR